MTTKSDIDQLLETLESCGQSLPAHMVRQLLRMLAERCDELEERRLHDFMQWQARCGKIEDGLALINIEGRMTALEAQLKAGGAVNETVQRVEHKSRILSNVYASARRLHLEGYMADNAFNEIGQLCYPDYVLTTVQEMAGPLEHPEWIKKSHEPPPLTIAEVDKQIADDTEHLLASPRNAEALAKSIKQAKTNKALDELASLGQAMGEVPPFDSRDARRKSAGADENKQLTDKQLADKISFMLTTMLG